MNGSTFPLVTASELREWHRATRTPAGIGLDIDDTLADTNWTWVRILCEEFGLPAGYKTKQDLSQNSLYLEEVPDWGLRLDIQERMDHFRHSNDFQLSLPPLPGVVDEVWGIMEYLPITAYISARPEEVAMGTRQWLQKHEFPPAPIIHRQIKPYQKDWKSGVLAELCPDTMKAYLDDNHDVADHLPDTFTGKIFIHRNAGDLRPRPFAIGCQDLSDAFQKMLEMYS